MIQRVRQRQIRKTLLNVDDESEISAVAESKKIYREISPRSPMPGVPFGLELFVPVERILVRPQELPPQDYEAFTEHMHYDIIDLDTGKIFFAWETDVHGFGRHRVYTLRIVDFAGRPVLQVNNITTCLTSIFWILRCFGQTGRRVNVNKPDGTKLSEVIQKYYGWTPKFTVKNEFGKHVMTIQGPKGGYCCGTSWLIDAQFPIVDIETGNEVGRIIRGSADPFESVDTFTMNFPRTLKVGVKVGLLGSAFAINSMFFDHPSSNPDIIEMFQDMKQNDMRRERFKSYKADLDALGLDGEGLPRGEEEVAAAALPTPVKESTHSTISKSQQAKN